MNKKKTEATDEVEDLLQAAQDEMLLKLSVDAHMSRVSPSYLHPDLHHRFQALKKPSSSSSKIKPNPRSLEVSLQTTEKKVKGKDTASSQEIDDELKGVLGDDLLARFAALKGVSKKSGGCDQFDQPSVNADSGDDEDEVEKVIRWAIDAARLDPSSPTDDESDNDIEDDNGDDEDDDNRAEGNKRRQRK